MDAGAVLWMSTGMRKSRGQGSDETPNPPAKVGQGNQSYAAFLRRRTGDGDGNEKEVGKST